MVDPAENVRLKKAVAPERVEVPLNVTVEVPALKAPAFEKLPAMVSVPDPAENVHPAPTEKSASTVKFPESVTVPMAVQLT